MNAVLEFDKVSKRFGRQLALDDFSLSVGVGSICALLGDNGAGKTTALRILTGMLHPDAGRASVLGLDSREYGPRIRQQIGYMPDRPPLYDWMTVGECGWFASGFHPAGFLERFERLADRYSLPHDRRVNALSKGMRAKVAFALALASAPKVLILDEPTSGLDPVIRREILETMSEFAAEGGSILLSSHQLHEVERVADRIVILRGGRKVLEDSLERLKENVTELTVTFADRQATVVELPGLFHTRHDRDRQSRFLCRDTDESSIARLRASSQVRDVSARRLNLEELYFTMMAETPVDPVDDAFR